MLSNDKPPFNELMKRAGFLCPVLGVIQFFVMQTIIKAFCFHVWYLGCILQLPFFSATLFIFSCAEVAVCSTYRPWRCPVSPFAEEIAV